MVKLFIILKEECEIILYFKGNALFKFWYLKTYLNNTMLSKAGLQHLAKHLNNTSQIVMRADFNVPL